MVVAIIVGVVGINVDVVSPKVPINGIMEDGIVVVPTLGETSLGWKLAILTGRGVEIEVVLEPLETVKVNDSCSVDVGATIM